MARLFALVLVVHGLIHLLGLAKAFRLAELPQLTQPISPLFGLVWLAASLLFIATAVSLLAWPRWWWALSVIAVGVSMLAVSQSWTDARVGAFANLVILVGVVFGFLVHGPFSLRAAYEADVERGLARARRGTADHRGRCRASTAARPALPAHDRRRRAPPRSSLPRANAWPHPQRSPTPAGCLSAPSNTTSSMANRNGSST